MKHKTPLGRLLPMVTTMLVCTLSSARAGAVLSFTPDGSPANFQLQLGETLEIPIYLIQTLTPPTNPPDITTDPLISFGVRIDLSTAVGSATITGISISNPYIDLTNSSRFGASFAEILGEDLSSSSTGTAIELGSITVAGNSVGSVTEVSLSDPALGLEDFATLSFGGFDSQVFGSASPITTISVSAVPEPSPGLYLGCVATLCMGAVWLRRTVLGR